MKTVSQNVQTAQSINKRRRKLWTKQDEQRLIGCLSFILNWFGKHACIIERHFKINERAHSVLFYKWTPFLQSCVYCCV